MTPHAKIYFKYFDYVVPEEVMCEACTRPAVDIHHINGRGPGKNVISNLMALCRKCHDIAHQSKLSKGDLQYIHNNVLLGYRKKFIK